MIARVWRSCVRAADAPAYRAYVNSTWLLDFRAAPGNQGTFFFHNVQGDAADVITLSFWDSYAALEAFLGEKAQFAGYYPEDEFYLLDFPERVEHFDVD